MSSPAIPHPTRLFKALTTRVGGFRVTGFVRGFLSSLHQQRQVDPLAASSLVGVDRECIGTFL